MKTIICFDRIPSSMGALVLAAAGDALTGVWFDGQRHQPPIGVDWQLRTDVPVLHKAAALLGQYFAGHRPAFDLPIAPEGTAFQRAVWIAIANVPYGETIAYRTLAERVGRPDAARAAGAATGRNPLSIIVPCHRIVGANGALTGYAGGLERKRALLALERGAHPTLDLERRDVRRADVARLIALAAIWGCSFIFIRVLAPVLGTVLTVIARVLIAGVVLVVYCRAIGFDAEVSRYWRQYLVIGAVNSTIPFMLFAFAALHIPASYSVILNSTTPLFTALIAVPLLDERLTAGKFAGLVAGAAGVVLVSKAGPVVPDAWFAAAVAACLGAALCYAISSIYMKRHAAGAKPLAIAGWSQVFAGLLLLPVMPFVAPPGVVTPLIIASVLGLALVCSAIAYVLYYRLIADIGPTRALTVAFLMPAFGMLWGALFLDETITLPMIAGCALIAGGTGAVLGRGPLAERT